MGNMCCFYCEVVGICKVVDEWVVLLGDMIWVWVCRLFVLDVWFW